jgi:hypothetical protein
MENFSETKNTIQLFKKSHKIQPSKTNHKSTELKSNNFLNKHKKTKRKLACTKYKLGLKEQRIGYKNRTQK